MRDRGCARVSIAGRGGSGYQRGVAGEVGEVDFFGARSRARSGGRSEDGAWNRVRSGRRSEGEAQRGVFRRHGGERTEPRASLAFSGIGLERGVESEAAPGARSGVRGVHRWCRV